jgi:hypothetical protein
MFIAFISYYNGYIFMGSLHFIIICYSFLLCIVKAFKVNKKKRLQLRHTKSKISSIKVKKVILKFNGGMVIVLLYVNIF